MPSKILIFDCISLSLTQMWHVSYDTSLLVSFASDYLYSVLARIHQHKSSRLRGWFWRCGQCTSAHCSCLLPVIHPVIWCGCLFPSSTVFFSSRSDALESHSPTPATATTTISSTTIITAAQCSSPTPCFCRCSGLVSARVFTSILILLASLCCHLLFCIIITTRSEPTPPTSTSHSAHP
jgi:hypothetical protein